MKQKKDKIRSVLLFPLLCTLMLISACSSTSTGSKDEPAIYYPSLPTPPRIQYLATFSTNKDLTGEADGFARFILGEDINRDELISKPYGVEYYKHKLYVVDIRGPGYVVFDFDKKQTHAVFGKGLGRIKKPINMDIDPAGNIFITDTERNQILQYDQNDQFIRAYGSTGQFKPSDVAVTEDRLYVTDLKNHQVHVLDRQSGRTLFTFGKAGSNKDELLYPTNIKIGGDKLYIADTGNFRVQIATLDGKFLGQLGKVGSGLGHFARPKGIAVDRKGQVYVVDAAFENVQIFDDHGKLMLFFGSSGMNRDSLNLPADIEIYYDNIEPFKQYAEPGFDIQYVILVSSQFGGNKINAYGYGQMKDMKYVQ